VGKTSAGKVELLHYRFQGMDWDELDVWMSGLSGCRDVWVEVEVEVGCKTGCIQVAFRSGRQAEDQQQGASGQRPAASGLGTVLGNCGERESAASPGDADLVV
jgi:hypothetical protein